MRRTKIKALLSSSKIGEKVKVSGWVRTKRDNKNVAFIALNDGSTIKNIQIVTTPEVADEKVLKDINTGACISVNGELVASQGKGQAVEIQAESVEIHGYIILFKSIFQTCLLQEFSFNNAFFFKSSGSLYISSQCFKLLCCYA